MKLSTKNVIIGTGIASLSFLGNLSLAQGTAPGQPAQPAQPPAQPEVPDAGSISDGQLDKTVDAYIAVNELQTKIQEKLAGENDQAKIQAEVQNAQAKMVEAVKKAGLEPQEYEKVMSVVTQNDELRQKFINKLNEKQQAERKTR
ncbi:MAG: DUF4168 domain-containing protein [Kiritimatiellia bacterium]